MKILPYVFIVFILAIIPTSLNAGGKKKDNVAISFHVEGDPTDNPKMIFPYVIGDSTKVFRRMPEISTKDIVAFSPFPSDDQTSYGAVLKLKNGASMRLKAITEAQLNKWLICKAFGKIIDQVYIDEPIHDGTIVIWKGLSLENIRAMDKDFTRIGEKKKKK